ncbi:hypothetical protein SAMN04489712_103411 [Thermomonospora echinospora]|uniref:DUF6745 domain-containing protein n=1 Tax=Thermomonospora echinospora TaxID=1992 RepID=A0A1H5XU09_9ACTN|nr:hypothetical protein [Thermomonospora echinospora]SEG15269.1 hypothetical protein SAMN04489712_103411 [Thermomonospora echinospora]
MTTLVVEDWQSVAFTTGEADRARAEAGVRSAYRAAGLAVPERFVWVPSPAAGTVAAALIGGRDEAAQTLREAGLAEVTATIGELLGDAGAGRSVRDEVRTRPWEMARAAAYAELGPQEWARAWARTAARSWDAVSGLVTRVRRGIAELGDEGDEKAQALLRGATLDAVLGQHDAPWLWLFDALGRLEELEGLAEVARTAGWWWPYERMVVLCERPVELYRDEPGRLHRGDGPALSFPDGFALHAWRGMPIPADFIQTLAGLTADRIQREDNAELRRVMLEHYGYDRYLADVGAKPLHRDETGVLWRIDLLDDEPVVMVEVVNSTPEPDGSYRTYYLRVPPDTRTARAGVAWTFGLTEDEYRPEKQT